MPFLASYRLPGAPIIVTTYAGPLNVDVMERGRIATNNLMQPQDKHVYLIIDASEATISFNDMMQFLRFERTIPENEADAKFILMMVGTGDMLRFYTDARRQSQFGSAVIPLFRALDDAINAARTAWKTGGDQPAGVLQQLHNEHFRSA